MLDRGSPRPWRWEPGAWALGTGGGSVQRVNRRVSLALSVAAVAAFATGCATFSDSGNVARVGDTPLTDDDFQAQLLELGAPDDQLLPAAAVRAEITTWIRTQVTASDAPGLSAEEAAGRYDAGLDTGRTVCINGIVVEERDTATRVAGELAGEGRLRRASRCREPRPEPR